MRADWKDGTLTIRRGRRPWFGAIVFLAAGVAIAQYAIHEPDLRYPNATYLGVLFGLGLATCAMSLVLQADVFIEFDTVRLQVRETRRGWLGNRTRLLPFDQVASVGIDTMKDPHTNAEWDSTGVLRPKSGRNWLLPSTDAVRAISIHTALPIKHQVIWSNEPSIGA
jgi:hypothetical protein